MLARLRRRRANIGSMYCFCLDIVFNQYLKDGMRETHLMWDVVQWLERGALPMTLPVARFRTW